jgi:NRAMP (natural resistance-associated macrophage protein)-like metal ion transporter
MTDNSRLEIQKTQTKKLSAEELISDKNLIRRLPKILGPGLITGASDDDPSGIGTYAAVGASMGFAALWLAPVTMIMMAVVQFLCAKIGMVTGRGLASVLKKYYSRKLVYPVVIGLVIANVINAGVDIGAIAAGINILVPIPITVMIIPISTIILIFQIFGSYRLITNIFKWLTLALFAYIGAAFFSHPDLGQVIRGTFIPTLRLDSTFLTTLVAILGTTISPYLFFWQADQEVEEEISMGRLHLYQRQGASDTELKIASWDVNIGMILSNAVMYFIILTTAATLFQAGKTHIQSATEAAEALRPLAGNAAGLLFAIGMIGAGVLAVPILTGSAGYAIAQALDWEYGLDKKPYQARSFYLVIVASTIIGMLINFIGINPIDALFGPAVINGLLAPPLLVVIMLISNNKKIMGNRVNSSGLNVLGWGTTLMLFMAALALIITSRR